MSSHFRDAQRSRDRSGQSAAETSSVVAIQRARSIRDASWNGASVSWQQTYLYRSSHLPDSCPIQSRLLSGSNQVVTFRDKLFETFRVLKPRNFCYFFGTQQNITNNLHKLFVTLLICFYYIYHFYYNFNLQSDSLFKFIDSLSIIYLKK